MCHLDEIEVNQDTSYSPFCFSCKVDGGILCFYEYHLSIGEAYSSTDL